MKTFHRILSACLACLCIAIYIGSSDRITALTEERDIYQSRAEATETELAQKDKTTPTKQEAETPKIEPGAPTMEYLGEFDCAANCCERYNHICGNGTGITASGAPQTAGVTIGADPSVIPYGTVVYIEGVGIRVMQDTGPGCPENHIDVAVDTHEHALTWSGYGEHKVYVLKWGDGE